MAPARSLGDGVYEATVKIGAPPATWYVFVGSQSAELAYNDLPFLSLMGIPKPDKGPDPQAAVEGVQ